MEATVSSIMVQFLNQLYNINVTFKRQIRGSIVVSISACHAEDPGSIPGRGVLYSVVVRSLGALASKDLLLLARVSCIGARAGLQFQGHGERQGLDSSSMAPQANNSLGLWCVGWLACSF